MKPDFEGREIRRLADRHGLFWQIEVIQHYSGDKVRLWWFADRHGRPPVGGSGFGVNDREAMEFLRKLEVIIRD